MILIIAGLPGSGKTTVAKMLSRELVLPLLAVGEILRRGYRGKTKAGIEAYRYWTKGDPIPADLLYQMILPNLNRLNLEEKGLVSDSHPNCWSDWLIFKDYLHKRRVAVDWFINLMAPEPLCLERTKKRLAREDDKDSVLAKRFAFYRDHNPQLLNYYGNLGRALLVSSQGDSQLVAKKIINQLKDRSAGQALS